MEKIIKVDLAKSPENLKDKQTTQMMKVSIL